MADWRLIKKKKSVLV